MPVAAPGNKAEFAALMRSFAAKNATLLNYTLPEEPSGDTLLNWSPYTKSCEFAQDCYCWHVTGDMSKKHNPMCPLSKAQCEQNCPCLRGPQCLFSDMRPGKILAAITAARAAGVETIIEEGRYGGRSAYMYALHGFNVISVEFMPLKSVSDGLKGIVTLLDGDGSKLIPELVAGMTDKQASKTMVIFDGEKRFAAYKTFYKIKDKVAVVIFDDSNLGSRDFVAAGLERNNEIWWDTRDELFQPFLLREAPALKLLAPSKKFAQKAKFKGGLSELANFHFAIVKAGGWT